MKKRLKSLLSAVLAVAMVLSSFTLFSVPAVAEDEAVAYLQFADAGWTVQYWYDGNDYAPVIANNVPVTGYGDYTVSLDFSEFETPAEGIAFFDVEVSNGESLFPNSYMTINEVKINGEAVEVGKTYTSTDDDVATRTNLYNEWVNEIEVGRTADGSYNDITATPVANDFSEITTLEVSFTFGEGVAFDTSAPVEAKPLPAEGTTAYLQISDNDWSIAYWYDGNDYAPVVANNATVTGYGQYTVSLDFTGVDGGVLPDVVFFDVEVEGGEAYFPGSYMEIESIIINGEAIDYGPTYTSSDDGVATRTNLFNQWVEAVVEGRTNGLDYSEVSATPVSIDYLVDIETIEVTFTLIEDEVVEVEEPEYVLPSEFNAFMMFSDVSGAWERYAPGTPGDTAVLGDGEYTVFLKASDIEATEQATEGQVFLVDIEGLGEAMKHLGTLRQAADDSWTDTDATATVEVFVDGEKVNARNGNLVLGDLEGNGRLRLELYNVWGSGTAENPVVMPELLTPEDEIKVVFTLVGTGLNTGAIVEDETPAVTEPTTTDEPTTDAASEDSEGLSAGVIVAIIVAAIAVIGLVVLMIMKKKK